MDIYWKLSELLEVLLDRFNPSVNRFIHRWENWLCLSHKFVIHAFMASIIVAICINLFSSLTTYTIFYLYPSTQTIQALQNGTKNDLVYWLNYWVVFAILTPLHYYAYNLFKLLPMHNVLKLLFGIWLYFPFGNGSAIIMHAYIIPMYKYFHIKTIDRFGARMIDSLVQYIKICNNENNVPVSIVNTDPNQSQLLDGFNDFSLNNSSVIYTDNEINTDTDINNETLPFQFKQYKMKSQGKRKSGLKFKSNRMLYSTAKRNINLD